MFQDNVGSVSVIFSCLSVPLLSLSRSLLLFLLFWLIKVDILAHIPVKHVSGAGIKELPRPVIDFPLQRSEPPANNPQQLVICMRSSTVQIQRSKTQESEGEMKDVKSAG